MTIFRFTSEHAFQNVWNYTVVLSCEKWLTNRYCETTHFNGVKTFIVSPSESHAEGSWAFDYGTAKSVTLSKMYSATDLGIILWVVSILQEVQIGTAFC